MVARHAWQGNPALDLQSGTITLNVSIISQASALKFSDGVSHSTYNRALNATGSNGRSPSRFAKVTHDKMRRSTVMCCACCQEPVHGCV